MKELCPKCHSKPVIGIKLIDYQPFYFCICPNCGFKPIENRINYKYKNAIKRWNNRVRKYNKNKEAVE